MSNKALLVIGAAGDVGRGIVSAAIRSGRHVVAAGRDVSKLHQLTKEHDTRNLACVAGDIGTEAGAAALWDRSQSSFAGIGDVVVSVNAPNSIRLLTGWMAEDLSRLLSDNLLTHFIAAKIFLPRLPADGVLLGIGGGTADFVIPKMAHVSMVQGALRNLYRGLAREHRAGPAVRELMIVSMVNGQSSREHAKPDWVTDDDVGRHVCAILDAPACFPEPILQLNSRDQAGRPDKSS